MASSKTLEACRRAVTSEGTVRQVPVVTELRVVAEDEGPRPVDAVVHKVEHGRHELYVLHQHVDEEELSASALIVRSAAAGTEDRVFSPRAL
jgi:hypothetical protein